MSYIRTKDEIYEVGELVETRSAILDKLHTKYYLKQNIIAQADTIEELIQDNDIIYIHDLYPDVVLIVEGSIKPFGYNNSIKLKEWLKFKSIEFDLYIKQSNGDYHKIAEKKQYRKLVLI